MLRWFYICLLRLHPRPFRRRFAEEMLWIFDQAADRRSVVPLVGDGVMSLARQWMLRSDSWERAAASSPASDGVPGFYLSGSSMPSRGALIRGGVLSTGVFAALSLMIGHGGHYRAFLIGSHHPSHSHLFGVSTSAEPADLAVETRMTPDGAIRARDPLHGFISGYFRRILVLAALDRDRDHVLSASEIVEAGAALATLDMNHDGTLSAEECGAQPGTATTDRARLRFMNLHPVLAALDADHNGEISASEMLAAPGRLRTLDKNYDGKLTAFEILPDPVAYQVNVFVSELDVNGDGRISKEERSNPFGERFRDMLDLADRNQDGYITEQELAKEIRRRADFEGNGVVTWEQMLRALESGAFRGTP